MVHHRIQKKKRNKLKPVDPFNKNAKRLSEAKLKGKNLDPKTDEQPIPKRLLELQELSKECEAKTQERKNRRPRNRIIEESSKAGFERRRFENDRQLVRRVSAVTTEEIDEKRLLAKFELGGVDQREIEAEYKKMDEEAKQRLDRKLEQQKSVARKRNHKDPKQCGPTKPSSAAEVHPSTATESSRKLTRKERYRELKKARQADERKEMILDAKEFIPFGSRVDAPPLFDAYQRKQLNPIFAKAGSKPLLLKSKLELKSDVHDTSDRLEAVKKRSEEMAEERNRVIVAYRMLKKSKAKSGL
ncbi:unnamed protein product [Anisakis simplex]|uniref:Coiled-coil domain-containing protein 137 n=1 Tax=Anisakis simplex TaxID=6269 RepID=A0A0M3JU33_ANISI|nr:unnamed protein product [Anisakis simplex]